jgi:hypothetical protein
LYAQCVMLLFGGHETTRNLIGNGLYTLLHHPSRPRSCASTLNSSGAPSRSYCATKARFSTRAAWSWRIRTTTGRFISSSHPVLGSGDKTISGALQWIPSLLSVSAMLLFGRHDSHIRYKSCSRKTQMSKQVPYCPPRTGLPPYLIHPCDPSRPNNWVDPSNAVPALETSSLTRPLLVKVVL